MAIRTLIIDDDPLARRRLHRLLAAEPDFSVLGECASAREAAQAIRRQTPDVVFIETSQPALDGLSVLAGVPEEIRPLAVFVTAQREHLLAAFELGALDYLMKPLKRGRFQQTLARIRLRAHERHGRAATAAPIAAAPLRRFVSRGSDRLIVIDAAQVDWMESANNYVVLHVGSETHVLRDTLHRIEQRLPADRFLRVSRFAIVNLARIREVKLATDGDHTVLMAGGGEVPLTRGVREVQERLESA